jgi:hypothetical protein
VFVLGDCEHFLFGQATETDAIFERDHLNIVTYCWST